MQINDAIRLTAEACARKHLAISTQKSYLHWLSRYGLFLRDCKSIPVSTELKMQVFLTKLAKTGISASTQNQAFNALLFFYRHVLGQEVEDVNALRVRRPAGLRDCPSQIEVTQLL